MRVHDAQDPAVRPDGILVKCDESRSVMKILPNKDALGPLAVLVLGLFRFLSDRVGSVAGHDPTCRPRHDGFVLKP